jgi:hypothetical protein
MNSLESSTCTFVITIWVDRDDFSNDTIWRGEIRNVVGSRADRVAFESLQEIAAYVRPFLEARGVKFDT